MNSKKKPNVLFFFTDQQRWDTVKSCGGILDTTPHADALAREGVAFDHAFTPQPLCAPARGVLQTGLWPTQNGVWRNGIPLDPNGNAPTLAKRMKAGGYETAYIGKYHLAVVGKEPVPAPLRAGYDDYWIASDALEFTSHPEEGYLWDGAGEKVHFKGYRVDRLTDMAIDYVNQRPSNKPFFLFLSYLEPHHQNDWGKSVAPRGYGEEFKNGPVPEDLASHPRPGSWRDELHEYYGCIKSLDENLGRIIETLKKQGIFDETLIIFTSDHGSHFKTRNGEYKRAAHDACLRIPLVLRGPGFMGGGLKHEMVSLMDLPSTILGAAGIDVPSEYQGSDIGPMCRGEEVLDRNELMFQLSESQVGRGLRTKKWTYSVRDADKEGWIVSKGERYVERHLYDNEEDPHQLNNLVTEPGMKSVRETLRNTLSKKMHEIGEVDFSINEAS